MMAPMSSATAKVSKKILAPIGTRDPSSVTIPVGRDVTIPVTIDHGGPNVFELEVEAGERELTLDNNRAAENRSAVLLDLIERLRAEKIELVRASDVPPPLAPF